MIEITRNYKRERKFNPNQCKKGTFRTKKISKKTKIILCKKTGEKRQSVQSVLKKR